MAANEQGLVTVRHNGQVAMKIMVGSGGYNTRAVAHIIRLMRRVPTMKEARNIAATALFGCDDDRVVLTRGNIHHFTNGRGLYRNSFNNPHFDPRWRYGIPEHIEIVDV